MKPPTSIGLQNDDFFFLQEVLTNCELLCLEYCCFLFSLNIDPVSHLRSFCWVYMFLGSSHTEPQFQWQWMSKGCKDFSGTCLLATPPPPTKKKRKTGETRKKHFLVIQSDLLGMVKWPFKGLSDLQLGDKKATLNHLVDAIWKQPTLSLMETWGAGSSVHRSLLWRDFTNPKLQIDPFYLEEGLPFSKWLVTMVIVVVP